MFSARALGKLLDKIEEILGLNPALAIAGILINDYDRDSGVHRDRVPEIRATYGEDPGVLGVIIPSWVTIARTTDGQSDLFDSSSPSGRKAAELYRQVLAAIDPSVTPKELQRS